MGRADFFRENDFNRICDTCGRKFKASATKKQWDGLITCLECYDPRHPQDFVRGRRERQAPSWVRPEKTITFLRDTYVDEDGIEYADEDGILYKDG